MDRNALDISKKRAEKTLQEAVLLDLSFKKPRSAVLRVTNKTGHKFPSGYEEGRRAWINAVFLDESGNVLKEIGKYEERDDIIFGEAIKTMTLVDPEETRVYEILFAISDKLARKYKKQPGKSFHSVLNDTVIKDNRIPPEGFTNAAFREHLSQPVGAKYADGQYWNDFEVKLPRGCSKIIFKLMYESVSWEYIKFLVEENKTDDWGRRLYDAWNKTGRCPPVVVAQITKQVIQPFFSGD
jgi:hypothetical protein